MTLPFLKKDKAGTCVELSKSFYPEKAISRFKEIYGEELFSVNDQGRCFLVRLKHGSEYDFLEALNHLLYFAKNA
ncbi:MAG: hypothetical protein HQL16_03745 [Candidatus Omnitrophica bacterium]|nr:hypothetical protein [Candidatus Omnitrophota bacterium]